MLGFLQGCDFLGYNCIRFDVPMLIEEFCRAKRPHPFTDAKVIDAYRIFCQKEERTLAAAMKFYCKEELKEAHSAHADTNATLQVLLGQLDFYKDLSPEIAGLSEYCQEEGFVDYNRKIVCREGEYLYNFGKNKGKKITDDPSYAAWMLKNDFPEDTKAHLRRILEGVLEGKSL